MTDEERRALLAFLGELPLEHRKRFELDPLLERLPWPARATLAHEMSGELTHISTLMRDSLGRLERRHDGLEKPIPVPWPDLGSQLGGGLWPGLHVLVGNTGAGKTQFCLQVALEAAAKGTPVLYVALEAGDVELAARVFGLRAGRPWSALYLGRGSVEGLAAFAEETKDTEALPAYVELGTALGWDYSLLASKAKLLRETFPEDVPGSRPMLVVLDFLQLVSSPAHVTQELRERIRTAANIGAVVAREQNAAVLLASSTARENYLRLEGNSKESHELGEGDPGRFVGMGKESGEIEFAASTVLVLCQEPATGPPFPDTTICHLAIAKQRAGRRGWVRLGFDGAKFFALHGPTVEEIEV